MNKLNIQPTSLPSFGWCSYCLQSVGQRKFRQLNSNQMCQDCSKKYKPQVKEKPWPPLTATKTRLTHKVVETKSHTAEISDPICKGRAAARGATARKTKAKKPPSELKLTLLLEEDELKKALDKMEVGANWRKAIASHLNWSIKKVRAVGRRLVKKGFLIPPKPIEDMILEILAENPFSTCYEIANDLPIETE